MYTAYSYVHAYLMLPLLKFFHLSDWIQKLTEMANLAYSILLAQLVATLINYPCTVVLPGLADWYAFLEWFY